ncbi:uncharacterized protein LOC106155034 [Lingula anatina]|uniref:Uncharacterized protein LOC106155034 n=1 Tax=Lingula anatina TaxID=7574 RepID=A0A1S3HHY0_LINAN|nr:uncharacterized protein LOC106155034 [Lingula anatina]|eukprot:XP_013385086.1 uncharacterized protein LOC106155034 [Lingula anatina]
MKGLLVILVCIIYTMMIFSVSAMLMPIVNTFGLKKKGILSYLWTLVWGNPQIPLCDKDCSTEIVEFSEDLDTMDDRNNNVKKYRKHSTRELILSENSDHHSQAPSSPRLTTIRG